MRHHIVRGPNQEILATTNNVRFFSIGNVVAATDHVRSHDYAYTYDNLNRLRTESINGTYSSFTYHANGNIKSKAGQTYLYGSSRPHAVTDVGGTVYGYDASGNVTSGAGRTVEYTVFDKPHTISKSGNIARFAYGPDRDRFKQVTTVNGNTVTKYYVAGLEILHD